MEQEAVEQKEIKRMENGTHLNQCQMESPFPFSSSFVHHRLLFLIPRLPLLLKNVSECVSVGEKDPILIRSTSLNFCACFSRSFLDLFGIFLTATESSFTPTHPPID